MSVHSNAHAPKRNWARRAGAGGGHCGPAQPSHERPRRQAQRWLAAATASQGGRVVNIGQRSRPSSWHTKRQETA